MTSWRERRRAERARRRAAEHLDRQLRAAADGAITAASRAQLAEPVTDLRISYPLHVTIGDVVGRARDEFNLAIDRATAAAVLRERLEYRGLAGWPDLFTDAYEDV